MLYQGLDTVLWSIKELGLASIGCIWIGVLLAFVLFIVEYLKHYNLGILQNKKEYKASYKEIEKQASKIIIGFVMFLATSIMMIEINYDKSITLLSRGALLGCIVFPLMHRKYS